MDKEELRKEFYTVMEYSEPFGNEYHDELFNWMWSKIEQNSHKHGVVRPEVESAKEGELLKSEGVGKSVCGEKPAHNWMQLVNDDIKCTECGMLLRA